MKHTISIGGGSGWYIDIEKDDSAKDQITMRLMNFDQDYDTGSTLMTEQNLREAVEELQKLLVV